MTKSPSGRRVIEIKPVVDPDAKIYPRAVNGRFSRLRCAMVWLTQLIFYGLCWLPWNNRQAVLFDIEARRFYLFDLILWPQDVIYLAVLLVLSALGLFLFTTVAGRLWCGYSCPQTVYTEIFLWIEKVIEGARPQRIKLDSAPWSVRRARIKLSKHGAWMLFSLWTGITFVGYFTPVRELVSGLMSLSAGPWEWFWAIFYGVATYGNAGFLREQMCIYICPYAQFQFVMFDKDTLTVTYDNGRGEPRGARSKKADPRESNQGDCVDCSICVQVCPTGIDIRNGLQLECIGCAACIDACDDVMDKMNYPRGLIRYSTENALTEGLDKQAIYRRVFRPRMLIYLGVFLTLTFALGWSLMTRVPIKLDITRDRAVLFREIADGSIENAFSVQVSNMTERRKQFRLTVEGLNGLRIASGEEFSVEPTSISEGNVSVVAPSGSAAEGSHQIRFHVQDIQDPDQHVVERAKFWMP